MKRVAQPELSGMGELVLSHYEQRLFDHVDSKPENERLIQQLAVEA